MDQTLYDVLCTRKSFHNFDGTNDLKLSRDDLQKIKEAFLTFDKLDDIKVKIKIVKKEETTIKDGPEYCILLYSEKKNNYLANIGYMGEQLDLYLNKHNIATLWCGMATTKELKYDGLDYMIMFGIKKTDGSLFRKSLSEFDRKDVNSFWTGVNPIEITRYTPSSCNTQPWLVESSDKYIKVYRHNQRKILDYNDKVYNYFNHMDIGMFLCFLELALNHQKQKFKRTIFNDNDDINEKVLVCEYELGE